MKYFILIFLLFNISLGYSQGGRHYGVQSGLTIEREIYSKYLGLGPYEMGKSRSFKQ